jgi:disulfide bond formation protein DsbB
MTYRVLATSRSPYGLRYEDAGRTIAVVSALALAGALIIEHIGGIAPCPLCLDQRIAYYAAVPLGLIAFAFAPYRRSWSRAVLLVLAAAFIVNAGLGVYHSGIEWGWWPGPSACSGVGTIARSPQDLLRSLSQTQVVRCDEAALRVLGISLAGYSAVISAFFAGLAIHAFAKGRRAE